MIIFWVTIVLVFIYSYLARCYSRRICMAESEIVADKPNALLTFWVMLIFILVAGLRRNIGDTSAYMFSYRMLSTNFQEILKSKDFGFNVLSYLLKYISDDPQILVFTTALIINALVVLVIYNYAGLFELGTYLYIVSGNYLVSMNGIRQYLVAAILFAAIKLLMDGKWKRYFFTVLLLSTVHQSVLVMIPVYFIVRREAWSKTTIILMSLGLIIFLLYNRLGSVAIGFIDNTQYGNYKQFLTASNLGANPVRTLICAVPLGLAFIKRKELREYWPQSDYLVNFSMLNFFVMLFATYNWIFARLGIYFGIYNLILLPSIIKVFKGKEKIFMYFMLVIFYFTYYYFENVISLNITYRSDYFSKVFPYFIKP